MAVIKEEKIRKKFVVRIAEEMLASARTAPKAKGIDNLVLGYVEGQDIKRISKKLMELGKKYDHPGFIRDAKNVLAAQVLVLFGTKIKPVGLKKCGMCGYKDCAEKAEHSLVPCIFNTGDLGIAIGSAVNTAALHHVDNRIMYTVGYAVAELGLMGKDVPIVYTVPLSVSSKNPFFDRA